MGRIRSVRWGVVAVAVLSGCATKATGRRVQDEPQDAAIRADAAIRGDSSDGMNAADAAKTPRPPPVEPHDHCPVLGRGDAGAGSMFQQIELDGEFGVRPVRRGDGLAVFYHPVGSSALCVYDPGTLEPVTFIADQPVNDSILGLGLSDVAAGGGVTAAVVNRYCRAMFCGTDVLVEGSGDVDSRAFDSRGRALAVGEDGPMFMAFSETLGSMDTAPRPVAIYKIAGNATVSHGRLEMEVQSVPAAAVAHDHGLFVLTKGATPDSNVVVSLTAYLEPRARWSPPGGVDVYHLSSGQHLAVGGILVVSGLERAWVTLLDDDLQPVWSEPYLGRPGWLSSVELTPSGGLLLAGGDGTTSWVEQLDASGHASGTAFVFAGNTAAASLQSDGQVLVTSGGRFALLPSLESVL
jgi:hypothetical protein